MTTSNVTVNEEAGKLTKKELVNIFWRGHLLQASWNFERMQSLGYTWIILPALKKYYKDDPEGLQRAVARNLEFFNVQPYLALPVIGTALAMEEKYAETKAFEDSSISSLKVSLMGPLAGIGDSIFWFTIAPITLGIGIALAAGGNLLGVIAFLILFNIPHLLTKYYGLMEGYRQGTKVFEQLAHTNALQRLSEAMTVVGLMVLGVMVATMINIPLDFKIGAGTSAMTVQQILDGIMPKILPLLLTLGAAKMMRKGTSATWILLGIIAICIVLAGIGFF